jgi:hypothetical protein
MKIIVCGAQKIADQNWVGAVLTEYCRKNKVSSIVTGQVDGVEQNSVLWAMEKKMKMHIVPTPKVFGADPLPVRNVDLLKKHPDAKVVLHFKGDPNSEDLCLHALKAKIPVDDVTLH